MLTSVETEGSSLALSVLSYTHIAGLDARGFAQTKITAGHQKTSGLAHVLQGDARRHNVEEASCGLLLPVNFLGATKTPVVCVIIAAVNL